MEGLQEAGCVPVVKHIPGHGRALVDSHEELPRVSASRDELAEDCAPFAALADCGAWAMTAHILYEALDPALPATLSEAVIGRVIRHAIGFDGVLVSDDLCMKALRGEPGALARAAGAAAPANIVAVVTAGEAGGNRDLVLRVVGEGADGFAERLRAAGLEVRDSRG